MGVFRKGIYEVVKLGPLGAGDLLVREGRWMTSKEELTNVLLSLRPGTEYVIYRFTGSTSHDEGKLYAIASVQEGNIIYR